jgi:Flp pilus assembly protein TadD
VAFAEGQIEVNWDPAADQRPARDTITEHLEAGRYAEAIPLLETTLQLQPDDVQSLTQLGMVKSDLGELEEARRLLERAVALDPNNSNALVSLGVAALRAGDPDGAEPPLQQAVALEPTNPYAHRALGQIHLMRENPAGALPHLRLAADQPPTDPITLYTLAQCLMALAGPGQLDEAEACLNRALALGPPADLAERLRQTHSRLARQVLRANAIDGLRMDVVMYCASALETYAALDSAAQKQLLVEVATAGQKGLALNRPESRLQLSHYRNGEPISHLQAACLLFVGLKRFLPNQESGFDFDREYGVAQGMVKLPAGDEGNADSA